VPIGTIIYVGNFELPDKGASANRVVSNGRIFEKIGYRTVFLGVRKEKFSGIKSMNEPEGIFFEE